jgi:hypothetical protein
MMSVRDHREPEKFYKRRMPHPEQTDLGTRIHKVQKEEDEQEDIQIEKCSICSVWEEVKDGIYNTQGQFLCAQHGKDLEENDDARKVIGADR